MITVAGRTHLSAPRRNMAQTNINSELKKIEGLGQAMKHEIEHLVKGIALSAFDFILAETPQWSGSMVASTRIYPGRIDYSYTAITGLERSGRKRSAKKHKKFGGKTDIAGKFMVSEWTPGVETAPIQGLAGTLHTKSKGNSEAIAQAYQENAGHLAAYKFGDTIFITNNVKHSAAATSYAKFVEADRNAKGQQFLRNVNRPSGMYAEAAIRFGNLGQLTSAEQEMFSARSKKGI